MYISAWSTPRVVCIYTPRPATAHTSVAATEVGGRHPGRGAGDSAHVEVDTPPFLGLMPVISLRVSETTHPPAPPPTQNGFPSI